MSTSQIIGIIVLAIPVLIVITAISIYNALVRLRNQADNAWSQIDVQLKRRHDLIPNLVETAKGYAKHESETLEKVIAARSEALNAKGVANQGKAEGLLGNALGSLLALQENYPDLKANQNFLALQEELASTENKIGFARQFFNDSVMAFNTKCEIFPANIIAGWFRFEKKELFEIELPTERDVPSVQF